ncbi:MAG TPA: hypothetical protein VGF00_17450 [Acidimicrobiia bacterium]
MGGPKAFPTGIALVGLYAAVVAVTGLASGHTVHPLLDGVGNTTPYRWVRPPWYVGSANVKPEPSHTDITFENGTSPLIGVTSQDAQLVLSLPRGAFLPNAGDTAVRADIMPLDPKKLGKTPVKLRPDGNAYKLEMTYEPSKQPLTTTTVPGNIILMVPAAADTILYSRDGNEWDTVPTQMLGDRRSPLGIASLAQMTVGASFTETGYYLAGTSLPDFTKPNEGKNTKPIVGWILIGLALLLLFGYAVPVVLRKARPEVATARPRPGATHRVTRPVRRRTRARSRGPD